MAHRKALASIAATVAMLAVLALFACTGDASETDGSATVSTGSVSQQEEGSPSVLADTETPPEASPPVEPANQPEVVPDELKVVWEVWERLNAEHVDRGHFIAEDFSEGAIRGMLEALDDRNTNYVRPEAFEIQRSDIEGKFEGIGAHVTMRADGTLIISAPIPGSPAEAMGLRPGDAVLAVDGVSIQGLSLLEAVARIRGPRGTDVVLTIKHLTAIDPIDITITRDEIRW